jgi:capsular exopolysaccharide synthesis family protein
VQLHDYIRIARRWLPIALVLAVAAGVSSYALTKYAIRPLYTSTVTMEVELGVVGQPTSIDPTTNALFAQTEAQVASQGPNVRQAIGLAETETHVRPAPAVQNVQCQPSASTAIFSCSAASRDPVFAAAVANALATVFLQSEQAWEQSRYQAVLNRIVSLEKAATNAGDKTRYAALVQLETTTRLAAAQRAAIARVVSPAGPSYSPTNLHPTLNAELAFAIVLLLVGAVGIISDRLDESIRGTDVLKELTHLPILGIIPSSDTLRDKQFTQESLVVINSPRTPLAEAFRAARLGITFSLLDAPLRTLVVTSTSEGEGKSTIAANLAAAFAESGKSVILIDSDLRRRSLSPLVGARSAGLTSLLIGSANDPEQCFVNVGPNLRILPSGPLPPNPAAVVSSHRMTEVIDQLVPYADMLIIDSPPVLAASDTAILASQCDSTVLVVRPDRVKRRALLRTLDILASGRVRVAGIVANSIARSDKAYYGAFTYYDGENAASSGTAPPALRSDMRPGSEGRRDDRHGTA